ncbi:NADP-dependent oxidoreductase [Nocardia sp. alder85J]|uniref:NADP-dependent oxidoreductase n=1 Tax=Nocardia sp. alder85J TaxID=2862949 RepID=UPI001CD3C1E0|nr:NADP-dependent oxidoreductase [Nocardia sp. alder85J]MCX4094108.1 NADP-dependent oxidoreductase [Nocardia sp. alder85J]
MRTLRFHEYGAPADVLRLEDAEPPAPEPGQIRVAVQTCGLTPADWALCGGLFPGDLPRGIGLEVAGVVDALGAGVTGTEPGDPVFGPVPFTGPTAGASDYALLDIWFPRPPGLDPVRAAALPMAVETACRGLDMLGVHGGTVLVHGAGTTVGYAAVQMALERGARVFATAGDTYGPALRAMGAEVTGYGDGLADRVRDLAGGPVDLVLDTAPPSNALPALIRTVEAPDHVLTLSDFAAAAETGVRLAFGDADDAKAALRTDVLGEYADRAAAGHFSIPVAATFPLADWATAAKLSLSGHAHGKLVLQVGRTETVAQ